MRVVVDASALTDYLVLVGESPSKLQFAFNSADIDVHAPAVLDAEVLSGISRLARRDVISASDVDFSVTALMDLPIRRHEITELLPAMSALRHNLSAYDASYVALAAKLDATLVTSDARLTRAVARHVPDLKVL